MQDVALGDGVGHIGSQVGVGRAVADEEQVGVGRTGDLEILEHHGSVLDPGCGQRRLARNAGGGDKREFVTVGNRTQNGIGLDQLDLRGQKLIGVIGGHAERVLADYAGGGLAVDIDGGGGLVDGSEARRHDHGGDHGDQDERQDTPFLTTEDPEVVGQREL